MKAVRVHEPGSVEALRVEEVPVPEPGEGQVRVRLEAVGVNFLDIYYRTGAYRVPVPFTLGSEGAGVVDAVGPGVEEVRVGDRVAYAMTLGAYAEYAVVPAWRLVPVPPEVELRTAAAALLQGLTAHYLTTSTYSLREGETALVHAAAGGTGALLVQAAVRRGATVFGTVSTEEKAQVAREAGAHAVIRYTEEDFVAVVRERTGGAGVHVVYDSVGQATFLRSLDCLRPRGYLVLFGQASGPAPAIDPQLLNAKGSLFLTRPSLGHYIATREELLWRSGELFEWIVRGEVQVRIDRVWPLEAAADAHRYLEGRQTKGKVLLVPRG